MRHRGAEVPDLVLAGVVLIWSGNNVLTKSALGSDIQPRVYVLIRLAIVAGLLATFAVFRRDSVSIRREDWPTLILSGVAGYGAYNLLFVFGLDRSTAFSAAVLIAMAPIFTLLLAAALHIERVWPLQWVGILTGFVGVIIFLGEKLTEGLPAAGDLLNLGAAGCFAVYGLTTQNLARKYGSRLITTWSVIIGLVAVLPVTLPALFDQDWTLLRWHGWIAVIYAAVLSMMAAYILWGWAIARTGAGRTVPYLFAIPIGTGVLSHLLLDDTIGAIQIAGALVAMSGVAMARMGARPSEKAVSAERASSS